MWSGARPWPAWRRFALPRFLARNNALFASLILGVSWALWHLPLLWMEGSTRYQEPVWPTLVDDTAESVISTWVFLHTRGSLLLTILIHGPTNIFAKSPSPTSPGDFTLPLLAAGAKWLLVGVLVAWWPVRDLQAARTQRRCLKSRLRHLYSSTTEKSYSRKGPNNV